MANSSLAKLSQLPIVGTVAQKSRPCAPSSIVEMIPPDYCMINPAQNDNCKLDAERTPLEELAVVSSPSHLPIIFFDATSETVLALKNPHEKLGCWAIHLCTGAKATLGLFAIA